MKRVLATLASVGLSLSAGTSTAFAAEEEEMMDLPNVVPVETWTCNFNDGKGMDDLMEGVKAFNDWADKKGLNNYYAAIVTPHYFGEHLFDVGWLGAWADGNAMGSGTDMWFADGGEASSKILSAISCDSHTHYASMNIKPAGEDEDDDKTFVLSFSNCSAKDGKGFPDVMAGMNALAEYQTEAGFQNSTWMMFPVYGESNNDYNYKLVEGHDDFSALGADFELMGNGGHWVKTGEIMDELVECDIARVYNAMTIRDMQGADDD